MAFRSRTGKLVQGLFGRFGNKNPKQPEFSDLNPRYNSTRSQTEIDEREYLSAQRCDDDEETNWDDTESVTDENNPVAYPQPIVPVVTAPPTTIVPDAEDWDEALPAPTVKNSNIQEVRRGKTPAPTAANDDVWDDNLPSRTFAPSSIPNSTPSATPDRLEQFIGLWGSMLQQLRRLLPAPIRQLSNAILTGLLVVLVTVGIWIADGLFVPSVDPAVAARPTAPIIAQPNSPIDLPASPEQEFIEAIGSQLSDITSQYADDIIGTLRVDMIRDSLIVELNPIWYLISEDRQNRVTEQMWLEAQANHFRKLEIQDTNGVSIARSPVVGKHPIILQRRQIINS
jgi:hypothetical protein